MENTGSWGGGGGPPGAGEKDLVDHVAKNCTDLRIAVDKVGGAIWGTTRGKVNQCVTYRIDDPGGLLCQLTLLSSRCALFSYEPGRKVSTTASTAPPPAPVS